MGESALLTTESITSGLTPGARLKPFRVTSLTAAAAAVAQALQYFRMIR